MLNKIKKVFCALFGHSHIYRGCFGYMSCARCGEMQGDTIAGAFKDDLAVVVDHNCQQCFENYEKLGWKDKLFIPYPFEKNDDGMYSIITKENRQRKMEEIMDSIRKHREIRDKRMAEMKTVWDDVPEDVLRWLQQQPEEKIDQLLREGVDGEIPLVDFFTIASGMTVVA